MRIVKEFNINRYKCTLFVYESKYTLQVEDSNYTIQFKLGDISPESAGRIENALSTTKMKYHIEKSYGLIHDSRIVLDNLIQEELEEPFPEIF